MTAPALPVYESRSQILTSTGFSGYQDVAIRGRDAAQARDGSLHQRAVADHLIGVRSDSTNTAGLGDKRTQQLLDAAGGAKIICRAGAESTYRQFLGSAAGE